MQFAKNELLLIFVIKNRVECSITELMKLCYLIELAFYKKFGIRLSDYLYIRYNYGPFESKIYQDINALNTHGILKAEMYPTPYGEELWKYSLIEMTPEIESITNNMFSDANQKEYCLELLKELAQFNAADLTKISYGTSPMKKLGATLGGNENLGEELNFND